LELGQGDLIGLNICKQFIILAQGLEEQFDITSRRRLERFIVLSDNDEDLNDAVDNASIIEVSDKISERDATAYYIVPPLNVKNGSEQMEHAERQELGKLPLLAVFHKMAHERGVPHSFTGTFPDKYISTPLDI
jgi:KUP system potassium uptake protein